ncbi:type II secretion system minor pseudopilin GspK [Stutzerimonas tarimensis]|uniref:Type II secretion system protein K n=1 Tax=Stutzerimonas tarimensis TaxID=1507735 RepID=A0ABV7T4K8_9GAMM
MNRPQRGVALITVLLVVAIVTVVSAGMIARQHLAIRASSNQLHAQQALHYALGGEILAKSLLQRDRENDAQRLVDHPGEAWAQPRPPFPVDHGEIHLHIEDLAGRFNLNSLMRSQQPNEAAIAQFRRLLARLDIEAPYPERLLDWLDPDQDPSGAYGAEDNAYLLLDPPYRTGGRRLYDVSELRLLLDMTEEHYQRLAPHVAALPADVALNLNSAGALVIASLDDDISLAAAEAAVRDRPARGHAHMAAFLAQPALAGTELKGTELAVNSQFFQATSEVQLGDRRQVLVSLLKRETDGSVRVLQRHLGQPARLSREGN